METLKFKLTRPAKSNGGDRYEHGKKGDDDFMTVYFPQSISRDNNSTIDAFDVTIKAAA